MISDAGNVGQNPVGFFVQAVSTNGVTPRNSRILQLFALNQCAVCEGHVKADYVMCGHRDVRVNPTECPGEKFYNDYVTKHAQFGVTKFHYIIGRYVERANWDHSTAVVGSLIILLNHVC